jgi:hypothetical protein
MSILGSMHDARVRRRRDATGANASVSWPSSDTNVSTLLSGGIQVMLPLGSLMSQVS